MFPASHVGTAAQRPLAVQLCTRHLFALLLLLQMLPTVARRMYSSSRVAAATVPVIDVGPLVKGNLADKKRVAKEIGDACENIGFFTVVNHHVNPKVIDTAWTDTRTFFDLDADTKEKYTSVNEAEYPYGYVGFGKEILSAGKVCVLLVVLSSVCARARACVFVSAFGGTCVGVGRPRVLCVCRWLGRLASPAKRYLATCPATCVTMAHALTALALSLGCVCCCARGRRIE